MADALKAGLLFEVGNPREGALMLPVRESVEAEGMSRPADRLVGRDGGPVEFGTLLVEEAGEGLDEIELLRSRAESRGPLLASSGMDARSVLNKVVPLAWKMQSGSSSGTTWAPRKPPVIVLGEEDDVPCCGA